MADPTNPPEDTTPDAVGEEQVAAESTDEAQEKLGADTSAASEAPEVVVEGDEVVTDEDLVLEWLEKRFPDPPLFPREPARRAEVATFVDWFNLVWKRPPNLIAHEETMAQPDPARIAELGARMRCALDRFETLLDGRDHLLGDDFGIADVVAFPFLKYMTVWEDGDTHLFHRLLRDRQRPGRHPRVEAWIARVDERPRA